MNRRPPRSPPSPTRRSPDLHVEHRAQTRRELVRFVRTTDQRAEHIDAVVAHANRQRAAVSIEQCAAYRFDRDLRVSFVVGRSEEHTSELQSQSNLVCRLLLE